MAFLKPIQYSRIRLLLGLGGLFGSACAQEPLGEARLFLTDEGAAHVEIATWTYASALVHERRPAMQFYTEAEFESKIGGARRNSELQLQLVLPYASNAEPELVYYERRDGETLRFSTRAAHVIWLNDLDTPCDCQGVRVAAEFVHPGDDGVADTADDLVRRIEDGALAAAGSDCIPGETPTLPALGVELSHAHACHVERVRPVIDGPPIITQDPPIQVILLNDCGLFDPCYEHDGYLYDDDPGAGGCESDSGSSGDGCQGSDHHQRSSGCEDDESESVACDDDDREARAHRHPLAGPLQNYLLITLALCLVRPRRRPNTGESDPRERSSR